MGNFLVSTLDLDYMFTLSDDMIVTPLKSAINPRKIYTASPTLHPIQTPLEIQCMILAKLVAQYIKDMKFQKAFETVTLNKVLIKYFHKLIFGADPVARLSDKIQQIRFCFMLTEKLYSQVLTLQQVPGELVEYFCVTLQLLDNPLKNYSTLKPWDFDSVNISVNSIESPIVNADFNTISPNLFHCLKTGILLGDITWLQGSTDHGIYSATRVLRPVIILRFVDKYGRFLYLKEKDLFAFDAVADHLKYCFGEKTGVFFTKNYTNGPGMDPHPGDAIHYIEELGHR